MSPRRSSRARTTQPPQGSEATQSSASSTSSARADRSTRSHHKSSISHKPSTPRSSASAEAEESARHHLSEPPQTRRRKRELGDDEDTIEGRPIDSYGADAVEKVENADEEGEVRCICGHPDYQGPLTEIALETKAAALEDVERAGESIAPINVPEAEPGMFIQCDTCKVWQHGGCVGIVYQASTPEFYFCELCRVDLHQIIADDKGGQMSCYLPVVESHLERPLRATSYPSKDVDSKASGDRSLRPSLTRAERDHAGKRRATMNSRDAAYDEEEQLRQAIEASKAEKSLKEGSTGHRKGKRGRGESEETGRDSSKRQRTISGSPSTPSQINTHSTSLTADSDHDERAGGRSSRARGAAAIGIHQDTKEREEEKAKGRADAAERRRGRAGRRRGDESDPEEELHQIKDIPTRGVVADSPSQAAESLPPVSQPTPDTPPTNKDHPHHNSNNSGHRKTGRPAAKKGRVGRNQYTKDRDLRQDLDGPSPSREQSRVREGADIVNGNTSNPMHTPNGEHAGHGKPSRPKYMHPQRTTMNEMKRRVAAILEFISRTQFEMASMAGEESSASEAKASDSTTVMALKEIADSLPSIAVNGQGTNDLSNRNKPFAELSSLEMMDVLTRRLVLWQKEFGKWGEK